jgi:hypothetical protein
LRRCFLAKAAGSGGATVARAAAAAMRQLLNDPSGIFNDALVVGPGKCHSKYPSQPQHISIRPHQTLSNFMIYLHGMAEGFVQCSSWRVLGARETLYIK